MAAMYGPKWAASAVLGLHPRDGDIVLAELPRGGWVVGIYDAAAGAAAFGDTLLPCSADTAIYGDRRTFRPSVGSLVGRRYDDPDIGRAAVREHKVG